MLKTTPTWLHLYKTESLQARRRALRGQLVETQTELRQLNAELSRREGHTQPSRRQAGYHLVEVIPMPPWLFPPARGRGRP